MPYIGNTPTSQSFTPQVDYFNGTGAQVAFTLSRSVASVSQIAVVVNNVIQNPNSFTVLGSTLTFSEAPSVGTGNVWVQYTSLNQSTIVPGYQTIGAEHIKPEAIIALGFPAGTLMLFQQTAAPTGWTKQTTHNDKALRVVSGTASSGGTSAFSTAMGTPSVSTAGLSAGATTLSTTQIPSHNHLTPNRPDWTGGGTSTNQFVNGGSGTAYSGSTGGGGSHTHSISGSATASINVQYVDLIIASKD